MPRINALKDKYVKTDLKNLIYQKMRDEKKTQGYMGELLGITQQCFWKKLQDSNFDIGELFLLSNELDFSCEDILKVIGKTNDEIEKFKKS